MGHGHTESWKLNGIHTKLVVSIIKTGVGRTNKNDKEFLKGKASSFFLLDFETFCSNSDYSPGEEK